MYNAGRYEGMLCIIQEDTRVRCVYLQSGKRSRCVKYSYAIASGYVVYTSVGKCARCVY